MLLARVYGPRRRGGVKLVRVEEHRRLGRAGRANVVVRGHGVQKLGEGRRLEPVRALFDHPEAEMDVTEESALLRGLEERAPVELAGPPDVVEDCRGDQEITAQPAMKLGSVPAERCHRHGVLQEPACVAVMALRLRG
jgi:hypothetical protein